MSKKISRKTVLCAGGIILLAIIAGVMWRDVLIELYPSETLLEQKNKKLKNVKRELQKEINDGIEIENYLRKHRLIYQQNFIKQNETGALRKSLETAAGKHKVTVSSIGTPTEAKLRGCSTWQINFSVTGDLKSMMEFLRELSQNEKKLFWRRFHLNPVSSREADNLRLNATMCAFSLDAQGEEALGSDNEDKTAPKRINTKNTKPKRKNLSPRSKRVKTRK